MVKMTRSPPRRVHWSARDESFISASALRAAATFLSKRARISFVVFSVRSLIARAVRRHEIEFGLSDDRDGPAGEIGEVVGVPAHGVGLGMGLPLELVVGDAFEDFARAGHFLIEFGEDGFGVGHDAAP